MVKPSLAAQVSLGQLFSNKVWKTWHVRDLLFRVEDGGLAHLAGKGVDDLDFGSVGG